MSERVIYKSQISAKAFEHVEGLENSERILTEIAEAMTDLQKLEKDSPGIEPEPRKIEGFGSIRTTPPPEKPRRQWRLFSLLGISFI